MIDDTVKITLSKEQANRLIDHLDDYVFTGLADIIEAINYQIDYHEFKMEKIDDKEYIPSFLNPLAD